MSIAERLRGPRCGQDVVALRVDILGVSLLERLTIILYLLWAVSVRL